MTSLATRLKSEIARDGPMAVDVFMARCLTDPQDGYYTRQTALGANGDFITAPEISQIFGELIGIWALATWQALGAPAHLRLVELGPGRGTLMQDVLRVFRGARARKTAPAKLEVVLVELDGAMRARQAATLRGTSGDASGDASDDAGVTLLWTDSLSKLRHDGTAVTIVLANEFFDALPVAQYVMSERQWCQRVVALGRDGELAFAIGQPVAAAMPGMAAASAAGVGDGQVFESRHSVIVATSGPVRAFADIASQCPAALLVIDYGDTCASGVRTGETLQAVAAHRFADVFEAPGMHDLSAHVDFSELTSALSDAGVATRPTLSQAEFLAALGLEARLATLIAGKDAATANALQVDASRLVAEPGMGDRFRVLCACSQGIAVPYPFA